MAEQKTCLIVDDSDLIREIASRIMRKFDLVTKEAATAVDAIEQCSESAIDAVLLDWDLPGLGALDFLRGVGDMPADQKPVIILCATENDPQQFTLAKAAGAGFHVLKPFDHHSMEIVLKEAGILGGNVTAVDTAVNE